MRIDAFDFDLPPERIAQHPVEPRDASKLLVLDPPTDSLFDRHAYDLPDLLPSGAVVIVNDTRVIRARLIGRKAETGG
ncbi:MAG: tRNA preQ1(34) S-adenosylmethionine ribosyltransferase-isomerase QueA, partial [Deltaproteobacteria bacterium HGW-Deltaproteobacteria-20]